MLFSAHLICRESRFPTCSLNFHLYPDEGVVGLVKKSDEIIDNSFDILALTALVLVPR